MANDATVATAQELKSQTELFKQIWNVAETMRGTVDGWDFKAYFFGMFFYRFISEDFTDWVNDTCDVDGSYADTLDEYITDELKNMFQSEKGYYFLSSQLFCNVYKNAKDNDDLNLTLRQIFNDFEKSAVGGGAEEDIKGLFTDFDCNSNKLGKDHATRNKKLIELMCAINDIDFGVSYQQSGIDVCASAYEYMMSLFAANAGRVGGEYLSPASVSALLTSIALHDRSGFLKVYDPTCGSGSLLLAAIKNVDNKNAELEYWGQELNLSSFNLCRMNFLLHHVAYDHFNIANANTLLEPQHLDVAGEMDAVVSNPPYSTSWPGKNDPTLVVDPRFAPAGELAPAKKKADWAFIEHALYMLSEDGCAAIVCFPGIFYRGGAEKTIRKYFIDNNFIDAIISMPADMFFGTSIATCVLVLRKNKKTTDVKFIRADDMFVRQGTSNVMTDEHIKRVTDLVYGAPDEEHILRTVPQSEIQENDYNLSVSTYVSAPDDGQATDIIALNAKIAATVKREQELREKIDSIISQFHFINDNGYEDGSGNDEDLMGSGGAENEKL